MEWICNSDAGLSRASSASSRAYAITNACPLTLIRAMLSFRFGARHQINSDWSDSCGFEALGRGQYPIKRRRSVSVSHESKAAISTRTRQVLFVRSRHLDRAVSKSCFWRRAPLSRRVFLSHLSKSELRVRGAGLRSEPEERALADLRLEGVDGVRELGARAPALRVLGVPRLRLG